MSRFLSADPKLTELATGLQYLTFELSEHDWETFGELQKTNSLINTVLYPDGQTYRVRQYLGGRQRTIGITKKGPHAAIYADMARLFFWKYRLRDTRPPRHADFNYGLERAEEELKENDKAARQLEKIRDHLLLFGELKETFPEEAGLRADKKYARERRRTAGHELREFLLNQAAGEVNLEARMRDLEKSVGVHFDEIKKAFLFLLDQQKEDRILLGRIETLLSPVIPDNHTGGDDLTITYEKPL